MVFVDHVAKNNRPAIQVQSSPAQPTPAVPTEEVEEKPKKGRKAKSE